MSFSKEFSLAVALLGFCMSGFSASQALASATQLSCDDRVADGGFIFTVSNFRSNKPTVAIFAKSRSGTKLFDTQELTMILTDGVKKHYFNRLGIRLLMTLTTTDAGEMPQARFQFRTNQGLISVPIMAGYITCYEQQQ